MGKEWLGLKITIPALSNCAVHAALVRTCYTYIILIMTHRTICYHILCSVYMQAIKLRLHRRSCDLIATGVEWTLHYILLLYVCVHVRVHVYSIHEKVLCLWKTDLGILMDLHIFSPSEYEKSGFWNALSLFVCIVTWWWYSLTREATCCRGDMIAKGRYVSKLGRSSSEGETGATWDKSSER
jgi:hypothetical protein